MAQHSATRVLATRLAGITHAILAGRLSEADAAKALRRIADWLDKGAPERKGKERDDHAEAVKRLFTYWVKATGRDPKRTKLTNGRKTKLQSRLREGYAERDIRRAIDEVAGSDFHQGQNDGGKRYDDITLICRSGEQLEKYRDMAPRSIEEDDAHTDERSQLRNQAADALNRGDYDAYDQANEALRRLGS